MGLFKEYRLFQGGSTEPTFVSEVSNNPNTPTNVGTLTFDNVTAGDRIELEGVFYLNNNNPNASPSTTVTIQILRNDVQIYKSRVEVQLGFGEDLIDVTFKHVDIANITTRNVNYSIVVFSNVTGLQVFSPLTFVGKRYDLFA